MDRYLIIEGYEGINRLGANGGANVLSLTLEV